MISKEEMIARFKARQEKKFGGAEKLKEHIDSTRKKIMSVKSRALSEKEQRDYQRITGRGYHE